MSQYISGRIIKDLVNNDLFGRQGFYTWDGIDNDGNKVPVGVYILFIEIINTDGTVKKFKKSCTLAKKM